MSNYSRESRHIATLCHDKGCCPRIFELGEHAPDDACIRIVDDSSNEAFFGPDTLLLAKLGRHSDVDGNFCLRDSFGNEVYMTREQHEMLFGPNLLERMFAIAAERGISTVEVHHLATRAVIESFIA